MKCSTWRSKIKWGNETSPQQGPIALPCLRGDESCAPWRRGLPAAQRSSLVPGGSGHPSSEGEAPAQRKQGGRLWGPCCQLLPRSDPGEKSDPAKHGWRSWKTQRASGAMAGRKGGLEVLGWTTVTGGMEASVTLPEGCEGGAQESRHSLAAVQLFWSLKITPIFPLPVTQAKTK